MKNCKFHDRVENPWHGLNTYILKYSVVQCCVYTAMQKEIFLVQWHLLFKIIETFWIFPPKESVSPTRFEWCAWFVLKPSRTEVIWTFSFFIAYISYKMHELTDSLIPILVTFIWDSTASLIPDSCNFQILSIVVGTEVPICSDILLAGSLPEN